jgi:uncharacterized protein (TIGR02145 family)
MRSIDEFVNLGTSSSNKYGFSVRCVMDPPKDKDAKATGAAKTDSAAAGGDKAQAGGSGSGTFTDTRDNKTYKIVKIGEKTWMAENLNYTTGNSWCYDNNPAKCKTYGRLYAWNSAKKVCPKGWHLPSREEWDNLGQAVGGKKERGGNAGTYDSAVVWLGAGTKLKAKKGWDNTYDGGSGGGTDDYGFSALPSGDRSDGSDGVSFYNEGASGGWWTSTRYNGGTTFDKHICFRFVGNSDDMLGEGPSDTLSSSGYSVRCIQD